MTVNDNDESPVRQRQVEEILAELMRLIDIGEKIEPHDWLTRYPDYEADLKEFFAQQRRVEQLVRPLHQAAMQALHVRCPHCHR